MSNARYDIGAPCKSPFDRETVRLCYMSTAKYGGDWHSLMHAHACTELFYVVGGQGQFRVSDRLLPMNTGDLIIVNPNVEHTELSLNASPLEYIVLGVEGLEFQMSEESEGGYNMLNLSGAREDVLPYLRGMLREMETRLNGYEVVCQDLLEVLVIKLMRHSEKSLTAPPSKRSCRECAAVKRYVDSHFKENLSLTQLADFAHVNKYHLVHTFHREYGISPINYLISRRIAESQYLLLDTDHSLSQISQLIGFSSPSYFSQSFRRATGMSPQEFRREKRAAR